VGSGFEVQGLGFVIYKRWVQTSAAELAAFSARSALLLSFMAFSVWRYSGWLAFRG